MAFPVVAFPVVAFPVVAFPVVAQSVALPLAAGASRSASHPQDSLRQKAERQRTDSAVKST